jgi:hypothetical protein
MYLRCLLKVKEKCFNAKYGPADMLLNVNAMICFKLKLQLKCTNKSYTSVIANFLTGLCINLK